jgi:hypothetical protein
MPPISRKLSTMFENNDSVRETNFAKITKFEKGTYLEMFAKTEMLAGFP